MNEFMQRPSRSSSNQAAPKQSAPVEASAPKKIKKGLSLAHGLNAAIGVLIFSGAVIALSLIALLVVNSESSVELENKRVIEGANQAVFLNDINGQVYFGDLRAVDDDTYLLSDVYYVRAQTVVDPETGQRQTAGVSLAKRGEELHGPLDQMYISKDKVLFWENLKSSGQVSCAIAQYEIENNVEGAVRDPACDENQTQTEATTNPGATPPAQSQSAGQVNNQTQPAGTPAVNDTPTNAPDPNLGQ